MHAYKLELELKRDSKHNGEHTWMRKQAKKKCIMIIVVRTHNLEPLGLSAPSKYIYVSSAILHMQYMHSMLSPEFPMFKQNAALIGIQIVP